MTRLGIDAAGVAYERAALRQGDRIFRVRIPEWLAAEVHGKAPVGIAAKDLFKRDLVDDARVIEAALPVGKGDRTAALEPRGDGWNLGRIGEHALGGQHQILIDVLALQRGQTARSAGTLVNVMRSAGMVGGGSSRTCMPCSVQRVPFQMNQSFKENLLSGTTNAAPIQERRFVPMLSRFCECGRCHGARPVWNRCSRPHGCRPRRTHG